MLVYEVRLGNISPIEAYRLSDAEHARALGADDETVAALAADLEAAIERVGEGVEVLYTRRAAIENGYDHDHTVTEFYPPSVDMLDDESKRGRPLREVESEVISAWDGYHSQDPPEWIEVREKSPDTGRFVQTASAKALARRISENYSVGGHECAIGAPDDWEGLEMGVHQPPIGGGALGTSYTPEEFGEDFYRRWREHELRTNAGTDWQASIMGNSAATGAGTGVSRAADYVALTENATAPAAGNTTLATELAVDGLSRAQGTYGHTNGTNTYTITRAYTFTRASAVDRTVAKIGVFNASSTGIMAFETLLSASQLLQTNGDQLTVTQTVTL